MIWIGTTKEQVFGEKRVALNPTSVSILKKLGCNVLIEKNAGEESGFSSTDYENAGAETTADLNEIWSKCHLILKIHASNEEINALNSNGILLAHFNSFNNLDSIKIQVKEQKTLFALERLPRISRAQSMDTLSSQANLAGYKAVLLAAHHSNKALPLFMTAAGTIRAAKILVLGAGVAGLQAIATAKRLGAIVYAYDIREAVKEQVESLGAKFVQLKLSESGEGQGGYAKAMSTQTQQQQQEALANVVKDMDIVITTAQIPGRPAPVLLNQKAVFGMKVGSVIVDMATSSGGNVWGSQLNQHIQTENGVSILGPDNLPSMIAQDASTAYANNLVAFLKLMIKNEEIVIDLEDEILKATCLAFKGEWRV